MDAKWLQEIKQTIPYQRLAGHFSMGSEGSQHRFGQLEGAGSDGVQGY